MEYDVVVKNASASERSGAAEPAAASAGVAVLSPSPPAGLQAARKNAAAAAIVVKCRRAPDLRVSLRCLASKHIPAVPGRDTSLKLLGFPIWKWGPKEKHDEQGPPVRSPLSPTVARHTPQHTT